MLVGRETFSSILRNVSVSVSQQSSPRRSLIPQPTRQRSTSLSKSTEGLSSPRLGRRADSRSRLTDSRNRLNSGGGGVASRRQATRTAAKLSPIQGTPTKPERTPQLAAKRSAKESTNPARQQKFAASPLGRNAWNAKKQSQVSGKAGSKERGSTSPSKIPLKTNRVGSSNSLNPSRFITISDHPSRNKKAVDKGSKEVGASNERVNESGKEDGCDGCVAGEKASSPDLHLIDLLKQTSTATGTSSVVSTTATTAVQPLHIDANAILLDKDGLEKKNLSKQNNTLSNKSSSINDDPPAKQNSQNSQLVGEDHRVVERQTNPPGISIKSTHKSNGTSNRTKGGVEGRNDSPIPSDAVNDRSRSNGTVTKSATDTAPQRSNNKIQSSMIINDPNTKSCKPGQDNNKTEESVAIAGVSNEAESSKDSARNSSSTERGSAVVSTVSSGSVEEGRTISSNNSGTRGIAKSSSVSDRSSISANNNVSASNEARKIVKGGKVGGKEEGRSSAGGVSVDSIESARSTDTGVSVDTVRGVSSPREKTGMHVVKRPQQIETLSGNVVHLEQNGEPA